MSPYAWDTGPIPIIENARDSRDWFKAIVFSAIQLERHGFLKIKEYLTSKNVSVRLVDKILKRIHLSEVVEYLLAIGIISNEECKTVKTINTKRNKFIHRRETKDFAHGREADEKYELLVNGAIRILKEKLDVVRLFVSRG